MKILIKSGTVIRGKGAVLAGSTHEVDVRVARDLFVAGKAVPAPEKAKKPTTKKPKTTTRAKK